MSEIRAVVFDIGGTLWFEARRPTLSEVFERQAALVEPLITDWGLQFGEPLNAVMADVWRAAEAAIDANDRRGDHREIDVPFIIRGAAGIRGVELTPDQAGAWHRTGWLRSIPHMGIQLYPDTLDVLATLRQRGLKLGVNTNRPCTGDMFRGDLDDAGIARFFDAIVCSGDTGFVKPHPSTFEMVLSQLGVAGDEAVMVGDTCLADMHGGKALGMRTVLKLNGRYDVPACPDADHRIHDLDELLALPLFAPPDGRRSPESLTPHDDGNEDRY